MQKLQTQNELLEVKCFHVEELEERLENKWKLKESINCESIFYGNRAVFPKEDGCPLGWRQI